MVMAEARDRAEWDRTSSVIAALFNANPFRKGEPATAAQFNPYRQREKPKPTPAPITALKMFLPPGAATDG